MKPTTDDPKSKKWLIKWMYVYHVCWMGCEDLERRRNA